MKKLLIIFVLVLCVQITFAQMYSTSTQRVHSTQLTFQSSVTNSYAAPASYTGSAPMQVVFNTPSAYKINAWKGTVNEVGSTIGTNTPRIRHTSGFPGSDPGDPNPDPPAPLGDIPWVLLLICIGIYILYKSKKQTI